MPQRAPQLPVCLDRGCSRACSNQQQIWLDLSPFSQAGSTGHDPTCRRPRAQDFENESSFNVLGVSGPMKTKAKFDLFSREVTVACRTIAS